MAMKNDLFLEKRRKCVGEGRYDYIRGVCRAVPLAGRSSFNHRNDTGWETEGIK